MYHQLPLYSPFITHDSLYRFTQIPFWTCVCSISISENVATNSKRPARSAEQFTWYNPLWRFKKTRRLKDANLQIHFDKSFFGQTSIPFLRHVISKEGLDPSPDYLKATAEASALKDMAALCSFLRLICLFSKFLPLWQLLRSSSQAELQWDNDADKSYTKLKRMLLGNPALAVCDPKLTTFITTLHSDKHEHVVAFITTPHSDKHERIVAFTSCPLSATEREYSTMENKAFVCVWAVER